jgi:hypothetical protein
LFKRDAFSGKINNKSDNGYDKDQLDSNFLELLKKQMNRIDFPALKII